ncbi:TPA: YozE family protein [Streptococcus suis]|nr:YozE family protein [Streptococcus suis]HEM4288083.1 YozE family protein [Streptococcus suis]HEM5060808.1 YozE family protein [Streptococcus suis]HEM5062989.1 YozE family protein [Streptococcus suis]HEM5065172.1 YozE family protein [Streptococcus suis]
MRRSFYSWLMTQRNPKSNAPVAILADYAFEEIDFPKQSDDFDEVSRFLEESASFAFSMSDFDSIWEEYLGH